METARKEKCVADEVIVEVIVDQMSQLSGDMAGRSIGCRHGEGEGRGGKTRDS